MIFYLPFIAQPDSWLFVARQDRINVIHVCSCAFNPYTQTLTLLNRGTFTTRWSQLMSVNTGIRISIPSDVRIAAAQKDRADLGLTLYHLRYTDSLICQLHKTYGNHVL